MRDPPDGGPRLPSAGEDMADARLEPATPQTRSPSYRLAYAPTRNSCCATSCARSVSSWNCRS